MSTMSLDHFLSPHHPSLFPFLPNSRLFILPKQRSLYFYDLKKIKSGFHMWGEVCDVCGSEAELLYPMWWPPISSLVLRMMSSFFFMAE